MKAMILAAGKGTRLGSLTDKTPKALITVNNIPIIEHVIVKLINSGIRDLMINVHHHAEQIISFIKRKRRFGINITISEERDLLDTGGGLKKASWFFNGPEPFILHNVDIISDINLIGLFENHVKNGVLTTLAVTKRSTSRYLLFDSHGNLSGRQVHEKIFMVNPGHHTGNIIKWSFLGIHVISPALFKFFPEHDVFSILDIYLQAAGAGAQIRANPVYPGFWYDVGKPDTLRAAENYFKTDKAR
jgi:NDP-sugar pyrophosphorylase family protein